MMGFTMKISSGNLKTFANVKNFHGTATEKITKKAHTFLRREFKKQAQQVSNDLLAGKLGLASLSQLTIEQKQNLAAAGLITTNPSLPMVRFKNIALAIRFRETRHGVHGQQFELYTSDKPYIKKTITKGNISTVSIQKIVEAHALGKVFGGIKRDIFEKASSEENLRKIRTGVTREINKEIKKGIK